MTLSETRKLGIEFERRVQTMIPEKEYLDKLDTETIYAYLNSYLDKYIHEIYRNLDQIKSGSKMSAHVESVLQEMLRTQTIDVKDAKDYTGDITDVNGLVIVENGRSVTYPLDPSFYMYVRSVSNVTSTYAFKSAESNSGLQRPIRVIPNELISQSDVWRLLETPHNSLRILRYPAASIGAYETFDFTNGPYYTISKSVDNAWYGIQEETVSYTIDHEFDDDDIIISQELSYDDTKNSYSLAEILTILSGKVSKTKLLSYGRAAIHIYCETTIESETPGQTPPGLVYYKHYTIMNKDTEYIVNNEIDVELLDDAQLQEKTHYSMDEILTMFSQVFMAQNEFNEEFILGYADDPIKFGYITTDQINYCTIYTVQLDTDYLKIVNVPTLNVIYDLYTTPVGIKVIYYAQPQRFDLMTSTRCELPMDAFDDLVTGAVDLYVQYVAGAEANKRRIQEAWARQARDAEKQSRRKKNQEEDED